MNKRSSLALLIALTAAAPAGAAGPYRVYRVGSPDQALSATTPLATVMSPQWVPDPTLLDGNSYYYFVRDGSGVSLDLHMGVDREAGVVRVRFNGSGTLHEDAIGSALDLFGPAGLLATMESMAEPGSDLEAALRQARLEGMAALDDLTAGTGDRDDNALKTWLDFCLRTLADIEEDPSPFTTEQIVAIEEQIVEIARAVVTYRLELAIGHCGPCSTPGTPVCQATRRLEDANKLRVSGGTPSQIVDAYGMSIGFSLQAMDSCF